MGRLGQRENPVVLTARGRRVAAVAVAVSTTSVALLLTLPGFGDKPTFSMIRDATTMPTSPAAGDPSSSTPPSGGSVTELPTGEPTTQTPSAPVMVNGREQPTRVEPPQSASGRLAVVPGTAAAGAQGTQVLTYRVEIEAELPFDGPAFAAAVHTTLADPRGWASKGYAFQRVDGDTYDMRLILASPALTDQLCAPLLTRGEVSCRNGDAVVLNALRWGVGIEDYGGDLAAYREYLVNHEVGHRIGRGHVDCPGPGEIAPVMMQQTYGLDGCSANPWPLSGE